MPGSSRLLAGPSEALKRFLSNKQLTAVSRSLSLAALKRFRKRWELIDFFICLQQESKDINAPDIVFTDMSNNYSCYS